MCGLDDETVRVRDGEKEETLCIYRGYKAVVVAVTINRSGNLVESCVYDGTVHVWDVDSNNEFHLLQSRKWYPRIAMNRDGSWVAAASDSTVSVSNMDEKGIMFI